MLANYLLVECLVIEGAEKDQVEPSGSICQSTFDYMARHHCS